MIPTMTTITETPARKPRASGDDPGTHWVPAASAS